MILQFLKDDPLIAFGPVPSRRLGYSLGINHIPTKNCSYDCVYCQVGRTSKLGIKRKDFYSIDQILFAVDEKISESEKAGREIDFLTLVPEGEPSLDIRLGELIRGLNRFQIPVAVISNASLIDHEEVQEDLLLADWVSLKIDSVAESEWHRINRPFRTLSLPSILSGILKFRHQYLGELVTETMLVGGINDSDSSIIRLCKFLTEMIPLKSYLSIPIRPPAETWVSPPDGERLESIFAILDSQKVTMDFLCDPENEDFIATGNISEEILGITAVHPLREVAVQKMIAAANADWSIVDELLGSRRLSKIDYQGESFYVRRNPN